MFNKKDKELIERRNRIRDDIVKYALQIARLKAFCGFIDEDGSTNYIYKSDVQMYIDTFTIKLNHEASFLLTQLTLDGETKE